MANKLLIIIFVLLGQRSLIRSRKTNTAELRLEFQPHLFTEKGTPFIYLLLTDGTPFA